MRSGRQRANPDVQRPQSRGRPLSSKEAVRASGYCERVVVADVQDAAFDVAGQRFDVVLLSHVLEHLRSPERAVRRLGAFLKHSGVVIAAVPNMGHWRLRWRFLKGDWRRENDGPLDRTHVHFWTPSTFADVFRDSGLVLERIVAASPAVPLWPVRRLAPGTSSWIDHRVSTLLPSFSATQVIALLRAAA